MHGRLALPSLCDHPFTIIIKAFDLSSLRLRQWFDRAIVVPPRQPRLRSCAATSKSYVSSRARDRVLEFPSDFLSIMEEQGFDEALKELDVTTKTWRIPLLLGWPFALSLTSLDTNAMLPLAAGVIKKVTSCRPLPCRCDSAMAKTAIAESHKAIGRSSNVKTARKDVMYS